MANKIRVPHTSSYITWRQGESVKNGPTLHLTLHAQGGKPIAKAKLTSEQLHAYICTHNTMK
jgi:hypothetical protein